jgi:transposase
MLEPRPLTTRQQDVLTAITRYNRVTGEPCPASYLARRFEVHHSTVQDCISALHQKGWLLGPNSPARARRWLAKHRSNPAKAAVPQKARESDAP